MKNSVLGLAILGGLIAVGTTQAQAPESGVGNDRTGNTVNDEGMMASSTTVSPGPAPNDDIKPTNVNTGAPMSKNTYGTVHSNNRKEVKHGQ